MHRLVLKTILASFLSTASTSAFISPRELTRSQTTSLSVQVWAGPRYTRKEIRVHTFLWNNWRRRRVATAEITFSGKDAGNVYTVHIKQNSAGRWIAEEYMRHYQIVDNTDESTKLIATGVALQRFRLRNGAFAVRLVTDDGKTLSLFE